MPRLISTSLHPRAREDIKPCSCCQSSRFKAQLYFCAMPPTVNTSFSSRWRVGARFTTVKVRRNIRSLRDWRSARSSAASLEKVMRSGGRMSGSYPERTAFRCSSTFIFPISESFPLMVLMAFSWSTVWIWRVTVISASSSKISASSLSESSDAKICK